MNNPKLASIGFAIVLLAVVGTVGTIVFQDGILGQGWIALEFAYLVCFAMAAVGTGISWLAVGNPTGSVSTGIGSLLVFVHLLHIGLIEYMLLYIFLCVLAAGFRQFSVRQDRTV